MITSKNYQAWNYQEESQVLNSLSQLNHWPRKPVWKDSKKKYHCDQVS